MIKKTLYFGNPSYLSLRNDQLVIQQQKVGEKDALSIIKKGIVRTIPIEDIGIMVLDHAEITITQGAFAALLENTVAVITCDEKQTLKGMLLPLVGNTLHQERFRSQLEVNIPVNKQLWQQTIKAKIENQAFCLQRNTSKTASPLHVLARSVKSDDADNNEEQADVYYWEYIFPECLNFIRSDKDSPINELLNYGYTILRAVIARALIGSGLLPVCGIHRRNHNNDYCLADDIMEPYCPFVDDWVIKTIQKLGNPTELTLDYKREMLQIPVIDVSIAGKHSPLMIAAAQTAASLAKCYSGESRKIYYPSFP